MQNLTNLEALIADYVEAAMLPANLADVTPADLPYLERFARHLRVTPTAALAIARESTRAQVAQSRFTSSVVAEALATAGRH